MAKRIRENTDEMCAWFGDDMQATLHELDRVIGRHREFERSEWLGGDQKANNHEEAPNRCRQAMRLLRQARKLIAQADSEVAMFRAAGDIEVQDIDDIGTALDTLKDGRDGEFKLDGCRISIRGQGA